MRASGANGLPFSMPSEATGRTVTAVPLVQDRSCATSGAQSGHAVPRGLRVLDGCHLWATRLRAAGSAGRIRGEDYRVGAADEDSAGQERGDRSEGCQRAFVVRSDVDPASCYVIVPHEGYTAPSAGHRPTQSARAPAAVSYRRSAGTLRKSQLTTLSGVNRNHA
jgi:hypothetical protein